MPIDKPKFYQRLRELKLFNKMTQAQVDSIDAILNECEKQGVDDVRQIAYLYATAYHECYNPKKPETRLTPIKEYGGEAYLKSKKYYPYFGRGFSGLTWLENYKKEGKRLNLDLVNNPDLILDIPLAANSHVYCMSNGSYTGKKLSDYINDKKCDYIWARSIVNGKRKGEPLPDKAQEIAAIAQKFEQCLT